MPELFIRNRPHEYIRKTFLNGEDFEHSDEAGFAQVTKVFPEETMEEAIERQRKVLNELVKRHENPTKRVLVLIATHAAIVKAFSAVFGGEVSNSWCQFCAFSGIEIRGKEAKLIYNEDESHLQRPKL